MMYSRMQLKVQKYDPLYIHMIGFEVFSLIEIENTQDASYGGCGVCN